LVYRRIDAADPVLLSTTWSRQLTASPANLDDFVLDIAVISFQKPRDLFY
jgi:hypothetical protein